MNQEETAIDRPVRSPVGPPAHRPLRVIVVGGGVSGSACAARLSAGGAEVLVVSSSLDVVGLPGYGPEVVSGDSDWVGLAETFGSLPPPLRAAWLCNATVPASGDAILFVDRRAVSVETKRALESMPGIEFRQALITDVRLVQNGAEPSEETSGKTSEETGGKTSGTTCGTTSVEVESAFGEVFVGDAVVLAPGLALGGEVTVGEDRVPGGRYGEVPANELYSALQALGLEFEEKVVRVDPRCSFRDWVDSAAGAALDCRQTPLVTLEELMASAASRDRLPVEAQNVFAGVDSPPWPEEFPLPPHRAEGLPVSVAVLDGQTLIGDDRGAVSAQGANVLAAPDGVATGEICLDPGFAGAMAGSPSTRLKHVISGRIVLRADSEVGSRELAAANDLSLLRIVGHCAGAEDYLESLSSGVAAAESLLHQFGGRLLACEESMPVRPPGGEGAGNED